MIFRDENGTESMRVGEFGDSIYKPRRVSPTIIQDEFGNELYRYTEENMNARNFIDRELILSGQETLDIGQL